MIETIVFFIFAAAAIAGALAMVWAANPVHSAMGLLVSMFSISVFYVLNFAHFVAAVQIIVYAGAVLTLFLFVVMLIGVDKAEDTSEKLPLQRPLAIGVAALFAAGLLLAGSGAWLTGPTSEVKPEGTIEAVSEVFFEDWVLPFEVTGLLFIVAAAGTIALAQFRPRDRSPGEPLAAVPDLAQAGPGGDDAGGAAEGPADSPEASREAAAPDDAGAEAESAEPVEVGAAGEATEAES